MRIVRLGLLALCAVASLSASPLFVSFNFTGSGTVNGTSFTDALVTISETGDTSGNTSPFAGGFLMHPTLTTIQVAGFSLATATDATYAGINQGSSAAYFGTFTDMFDLADPAFASYSLLTSLGPLSNVIGGNANFISSGVNTDLGVIKVVTMSNTGTFQATVSAPEPGASAMLLSGFGAILLAVRRRGSNQRS